MKRHDRAGCVRLPRRREFIVVGWQPLERGLAALHQRVVLIRVRGTKAEMKKGIARGIDEQPALALFFQVKKAGLFQAELFAAARQAAEAIEFRRMQVVIPLPLGRCVALEFREALQFSRPILARGLAELIDERWRSFRGSGEANGERELFAIRRERRVRAPVEDRPVPFAVVGELLEREFRHGDLEAAALVIRDAQRRRVPLEKVRRRRFLLRKITFLVTDFPAPALVKRNRDVHLACDGFHVRADLRELHEQPSIFAGNQVELAAAFVLQTGRRAAGNLLAQLVRRLLIGAEELRIFERELAETARVEFQSFACKMRRGKRSERNEREQQKQSFHAGAKTD